MQTNIVAGVAELADAPDLGSGKLDLWGFKSPLSHHNLGVYQTMYIEQKILTAEIECSEI